jgi:hypothetical protein
VKSILEYSKAYSAKLGRDSANFRNYSAILCLDSANLAIYSANSPFIPPNPFSHKKFGLINKENTVLIRATVFPNEIIFFPSQNQNLFFRYYWYNWRLGREIGIDCRILFLLIYFFVKNCLFHFFNFLIQFFHVDAFFHKLFCGKTDSLI